MTDFIAWIPPSGAVVEPPVHVETVVDTFYSDGATYHNHSAGRINWSAEGDGPRVVAYAVVQEYKPAPEPREWWRSDDDGSTSPCHPGDKAPFMVGYVRVREVPDPSREVVAWAVIHVDGSEDFASFNLKHVMRRAGDIGGAVIKLTGFLP